MILKEYIRRKQEITNEPEKLMNEVGTIIKNILFGVQVLMQRPNWQKEYKAKVLSLFFDFWDKMVENNKIFIKESEDVLK